MRPDPATAVPVRQGKRLHLVQIHRPWQPKPGGNTLRLHHQTVFEYADGTSREASSGSVDVAVDDLARFAGVKRLLGLTDPAQVADALQEALYDIEAQATAEADAAAKTAAEKAAQREAQRLAAEADRLAAEQAQLEALRVNREAAELAAKLAALPDPPAIEAKS